MSLSKKTTTRLPFPGLVSVAVWFCAFALLPLPQMAGLALAKPVSGECPCPEDGGSFEEELVVWSSSRRRMSDYRHHDFSVPHDAGDRHDKFTSSPGRVPAVNGHQLHNGLSAPLLI